MVGGVGCRVWDGLWREAWGGGVGWGVGWGRSGWWGGRAGLAAPGATEPAGAAHALQRAATVPRARPPSEGWRVSPPAHAPHPAGGRRQHGAVAGRNVFGGVAPGVAVGPQPGQPGCAVERVVREIVFGRHLDRVGVGGSEGGGSDSRGEGMRWAEGWAAGAGGGGTPGWGQWAAVGGSGRQWAAWRPRRAACPEAALKSGGGPPPRPPANPATPNSLVQLARDGAGGGKCAARGRQRRGPPR